MGREGEGGRYELQTLQNLASDPAKYDVIILKEGGREEGEDRRKREGENGWRKWRGEREKRKGGTEEGKWRRKGREVGSPALWSIMVDVVCQEH